MQWQVPRLSSEAKSILLHGDWPGNVRQLQKAVVYAVTTGNGEWIVPGNFPDDVFSTSIAPSKSLISPDPIRDAEIETIQKALTATDHDVAQAAKMLNMGKSTLYKKIKKYQLR